MNNELLIEKLISNTENGKQYWTIERSLPSCVVIVYEEITKMFSTNITDDMKFYLIEYSYLKYFPEFDNYRPRYSLYASLIKDNVEVGGFDRSSMYGSSIMEKLLDLIVKQIYNPDEDIERFIEG
jgi:hypothetical protein